MHWISNAVKSQQYGSIGINLVVATLLLLVVGVFAWWVLPVAWVRDLNASAASTAALIRSWGALGMVGSIGLMIVHSFLPFPAEILAVANGVVYGPVWGAIITWVGAMLGASSAFWLVRLLGRPAVERLLPLAHRHRLAGWSRDHGGVALLISRLIPLIAFNLINYVAGLSGISWWTFVWATGLGILPLTILLATVGDAMLKMPVWAWLLLIAIALISWIVSHRRPRGVQRTQSSEPR